VARAWRLARPTIVCMVGYTVERPDALTCSTLIRFNELDTM
jgi:hypothetical protein